SIIQDVPTNYDTDLFMPIIHHVERVSGQKYRVNPTSDIAFKIIADHIRTVTFAVADGALPSNEGRGYILRRLIRRAVRWAKKLGLEKPFMAQLVPTVAEVMADYYPYVTEHIPFIQKVITNEEERFLETLNDGLAILATFMETATDKTIAGADAFKLYDTYGFPIELTQEYAADHDFAVDLDGFAVAMEEQRTRARNAREDMDSMQAQNPVLRNFTTPTNFVGYEALTATGTVALMLQAGEATNRLRAGETGQVILSETSFYAESGGQVGDTGMITSETVRAQVIETKKAPNGQALHTVEVVDGTLELHEAVTTQVDAPTRLATIKNHTATHILHKALKEVLGTHVNQAGSLVKADTLRFDFSHISGLSTSELAEVELKVNQAIWQALPMNIAEMPIAQAKEVGAMALFGEKYGDVVRVVRAGEYSVELCGGCHVQNTAEIGMFKIVSESGIGSGVRRIEAVTGQGAYTYTQAQAQKLQAVAQLVKVNNVDQIAQRVQQMVTETKETARELDGLKAKIAQAEANQLITQVQIINGIEVLAVEVSGLEMGELRELVDRFKEQLTTGVVVLLSNYDGRVNICAGATKAAVASGAHAGQLIKEVATICGGKGGGRPDMAQAGATNVQAIGDAIAYVQTYVAGLSK
ncbi:MAG: alanine--tRNA ligase, partial [Culicoidibacterales bacterium]